MKLKDKKFLVKWLGYTIEKDPTGRLEYFINGHRQMFLREWNPDTNPEQFKEVFNKLDVEQRKLSEQIYLESNNPYYNNHADSGIEILLNDLPRIVQAVIEVIKEESKVLQE